MPRNAYALTDPVLLTPVFDSRSKALWHLEQLPALCPPFVYPAFEESFI